MGAFEDLYNHFEKNMGNIGATRGIFREDNAARPIEAEDGDIRYMSKDDKEEALIRYRKNVEVKTKKGFNSGEIGCINNFYLSAEDWIEINERECEMEIKEYE